MMFRGTARYPEKQYERRIQEFGADNNAYTTQDFTLYTMTAPSSVLAEIVEIESDRFQRLAYSEEQFRTETGAVLGEYNKSASSPSLKMWEALSEMSFGRHTYGHTTLGYLRDIQAMPEKLDYSRRFLRRFYTPDNTTIIVAGDVRHDALVALVRAKYGAWRGRRAEPRIPAEPEPAAGARRHIDWEGTSPPRMVIGWRTPSFDGGERNAARRASAIRDTAALQVVHGLLFHESSALYQRLVVDEQKLLELGSWPGEFSRDPHLLVASAVLKSGPGAEFDPVLDAIQAEVGRVAAGEVPRERIDAVKSHVRYALLTGLETPDDVAELVAQFLAVGGALDALDAYVAALAAVTPEDVQRVASRYLVPERRFVVTLAPGAAAASTGASDGEAP
jgi:zinc protease